MKLFVGRGNDTLVFCTLGGGGKYLQIWGKSRSKSAKTCLRSLWMLQSNLTGVSKEISAKFVLEIHFWYLQILMK